jgi:hypothetical protein
MCPLLIPPSVCFFFACALLHLKHETISATPSKCHYSPLRWPTFSELCDAGSVLGTLCLAAAVLLLVRTAMMREEWKVKKRGAGTKAVVLTDWILEPLFWVHCRRWLKCFRQHESQVLRYSPVPCMWPSQDPKRSPSTHVSKTILQILAWKRLFPSK